MARRSRTEPQPVAALVGRCLSFHAQEKDLRFYELIDRWPSVVGDRVAAHSMPLSLRQGRLVVGVDNHTWLNELSFLRTDLLEKVRTLMGPEAIVDLKLVFSTRQSWTVHPSRSQRSSSDAKPAPLAPMSDALVRQATEDTSDAQDNPELDAAMKRARVAQLRRPR